jgi:iron(III) transport system ATP-binding protein
VFQISFEQVGKGYRPGRAVVENLSFRVRKGEIFTLLGPSGCGKTTTLRLAAGFERPDRGLITIAGREVAGPGVWVPPEKRGVGMVFQNYALFPHLDVISNVAFGLNTIPPGQRAARAREFTDLVGLSGYEKRFPHEISGGQQQRVALARALCPGPLVVLLDEPFSSLDAELKEQMRAELKRVIRAAGCTAVLVTHDQKEALAISDSIMVMRNGEIQQVGDPRSLYLRPANEFVAAFVGKSNLMDGRVSQDRRFIETDLGKIPCRPEDLSQHTGAVRISVRPEGFDLNGPGDIAGRVKAVSYLGSDLECLVEVPLEGGGVKDLLVRADPRRNMAPGETVAMRVIPEFVAVL